MAIDPGTIDITDTVEKMRKTFVLAGVDYIMGLLNAIPGIGAIGAWLVKVLGGRLIDWVLNKLGDWSVMQAFFLNTALRKGAQATEYVGKVHKKNNLPPTATDAEYEKAERDEIDSFNRFILATN